MQLLCTLDALCQAHVGQVVLTVNVPEPALIAQVQARPWAFELTLLQNPQPKGFGPNHNAAFAHHKLDYFCVLNPDIDFEADPFGDLIRALTEPPDKLGIDLQNNPLAGCSFPVQVDKAGRVQDHARQLPSPSALLARYSPFGHSPFLQSLLGAQPPAQPLHQPDWVNGAFMLFRTAVFKQLGGFDERYFMYCEDVDICLRLQLAGFGLVRCDARVTHAAQRNTRVNLKHLVWHIASLLRLWRSASYREFARLKPAQSKYRQGS